MKEAFQLMVEAFQLDSEKKERERSSALVGIEIVFNAQEKENASCKVFHSLVCRIEFLGSYRGDLMLIKILWIGGFSQRFGESS